MKEGPYLPLSLSGWALPCPRTGCAPCAGSSLAHSMNLVNRGRCFAVFRLPLRRRLCPSNRTDPLSGSSFSTTFLSLDIPFFLFPIFFGLTARVIPLRSALRVFCFHGSSPDSMGPSHKADASLRLHAPSLSLVPQRKRGRKKGKRKCPIYMLSGIGFRGTSLADRSLIEACSATHGPLPKRRPATP